MSDLPRIAVTIGDPSGVGPELAMKILSEPANLAKAEVTLLASASELERYSAECAVTVPTGDAPGAGHVFLDVPELADAPVERKTMSVEGGRRAMTDLLHAVDLFKAGTVDSILFESLNKTALHLAGMHEQDELRWFAKQLGYTGFTSELNFVPGLTTSRVTSHIGIKDVAAGIKQDVVKDAILMLNDVVKGTGVERPRLTVCALNPHGGENGQFGREEIDEIAPGIELAKAADPNLIVEGPFPPDTIFIKARDGQYDGVVTMYHDQGQIAMKLMGFDQGVTVQGGLPVPICTPAHGTAYEIVGKNIAHVGPSQRAFDIACDLGARVRADRDDQK